jgi:hypothetical protein
MFASKLRPSMITRSASLIFIVSEGISSKVWEFTPSGTNPTKLILSPPIFCTIFVIGATEVTTFSLSSWTTSWLLLLLVVVIEYDVVIDMKKPIIPTSKINLLI